MARHFSALVTGRILTLDIIIPVNKPINLHARRVSHGGVTDRLLDPVDSAVDFPPETRLVGRVPMRRAETRFGEEKPRR